MLGLIAIVALVVALIAGCVHHALAIPPWEPLPNPALPSPNAYDTWAEVVPAFKSLTSREREALSDDATPVAEVRRILEPYREALDRLEPALGQPAVIPYDYTTADGGANTVYPFQAVALWLAEARVFEADGRIAEAVDSALDAIQLCVDFASHGNGSDTLSAAGSQRTGTRWMVQRVEKLPAPVARRALERVNRMRPLWPTAEQVLQRDRPQQLQFLYYAWDEIDRERDSAARLRVWRRQIGAGVWSRRQGRALLSRQLDALEAEARKPTAQRVEPPESAALDETEHLVINNLSLLLAVDAGSFRLDFLRLRLALRIHGLEHGAYPAALEELASLLDGDVPLDVFTGEALHYRRDGNTYRLWSVGPNGTDDDGAGDDLLAGALWKPTQ